MAIIAYRSGRAALADMSQSKSGYAATTGASHYDSLKSAGAAYQVTAGKTLYITRVFFNNNNAPSYFSIGYADTSIADGVGPPTNPIRISGNIGNGVNYDTKAMDILAIIPASKYPYMLQNAVANLIDIGWEGFEA